MSLRHAANRFRKTPLAGWTGTAWVENVTRGAFIAGDRFISDREFGNKLRNVLLDPSTPLPDSYHVVKVGTDNTDQVYLVCRKSHDAADTIYSTTLTLRRAYYTCTIESFTSQTSASGMKTTPVRQTLGTFFCDRENITFAASKEFATVRFGDEHVILPADTPVTTSHEILIEGKRYEIEEVFDFNGLRYCRCIAKPAT